MELRQHRYRMWLDSFFDALARPSPDLRGYAAYAGFLLVAAFASFYGLADYGIIDGNESLYVEAAREMLLTHDWSVPTLDGLPYVEKPPLFVWLIAAVSGLGGSVELGARSVSAGAGLLLALGTGHFAGRLGVGKRGIVAAFILVTSLGMVLMSRVAMPDMLLTALFALACLSFLEALLKDRIGLARLAAGLLGAAFLVKGAIAVVLFGLILTACYGLEKTWRAAIRRCVADPVAILLLLLPAAAWLVEMDASLPGAASYFLIDEHILRFLGKREPHDYYSGSIFYYLPRLFVFFFPWSGVLLFGWLARNREDDIERGRVRRFLWLCVWIPFAFFSASSAKANYYVILCLPPMALLAAEYLPCLLRSRGALPFAMAVILPVALFAVLMVVGAGSNSGSAAFLAPLHAGLSPATAAAGVALALAALLFVKVGWRRLSLACVGGLMVPLSFQFHELAVAADPLISARSMAAYIKNRGEDAPVFLFEDFEASGALPVYLGKTIPVIDSKSNDLYFGRRRLPRHGNFVKAADVAAAGNPTMVVVLKSRQRDFLATPMAAHAVEIATRGRATLYRLRPAAQTMGAS